MRRPWRPTAAAVLLGLVAAAGGSCSLVAQPDAKGWDEQAEQALKDASGEVATTRLALETASQKRAWSSYAVVLVTQAEEAVGTVEDDLAKVQVPSSREQEAEEVLGLVEDAAAVVRDARSLVVEGEYDDPAVMRDLDRVADALERASGGS